MGIDTLNLIYHLCPVESNDVWLRNLYQLLKRWHIFNGKKIINIATGPGLVPVNRVINLIGKLNAHFIYTPNDLKLCEAASFSELLRLIYDPGPKEATFYAHSKGVSRVGSTHVTNWRNSMYSYLLDNPEIIKRKLLGYPCIGCYRQYHFPGTLDRVSHLTELQRRAEWHYCGTFFWFRNKDLFTRDWDRIARHRYEAEFYLPKFFEHSQAACLYMDNPKDPYKYSESFPDASNWYIELMEKLCTQV